MERRSEQMGRLLRAATAAISAIEGKTQQAVEADLGERIGVAGPSVQRYKAGHLPPDSGSILLLAGAGVQRGLMGRVWLERFLEAARLPRYAVEAALAEHFPAPPAAAQRTLRPNLPPPTYVRFIMRETPYATLLNGLRSELPATLIVSLGGMGKTSLARAAVEACLNGEAAMEPFAAAVWVGDKDRSGATNLSTTLDAVARVLDYPGLIALPFTQRRDEIEQLLRQQRVLLVVDNADTITDRALLEWLARLPSPSKALVTSRFALPALSPVYEVPLGPMEPHELRALIADWLPRSRLRGLPQPLEQLDPIAGAVGGNPKALELALGLLQHRARDVVLDEIRTARGEIFDELFGRAWELIDRTAQRVLFALSFFPASASAEALAYCADCPVATFARSAEQLAGLALLDGERDDLGGAPRYNAHPLVRAFARARWADLPTHEGTTLRERWLRWCCDTARAVGFCWDNLDRLSLLDREHEVVQAAVIWADEHGYDSELIALCEGVRYYYNVRGTWGEEALQNHERRAAAAWRLGDRANELLAMAHLVQTLCKQGRVAEAEPFVKNLVVRGQLTFEERLSVSSSSGGAPSGKTPLDDAAFEYAHAQALYARARGELDEAEVWWRRQLRLAERLGGQNYVVNRRWLATVLLQRGELSAARALFVASLEDAIRINDLRSVAGNTLKLAAIDLEYGALAEAAPRLEQARAMAVRYSDRRRLAECHHLAARLLARNGSMGEARAELLVAIDHFERLGLRRELDEARLALAQLGTALQVGEGPPS